MELDDTTLAPEDVFNMDVQDWYELKAMLSTAEAVVTSALNRSESRGAHQRLDIPHTVAEFDKNQFVSLDRSALSVRWQSVHHSEVRSA
jgi:succinate dehydrogenase/fumarate reductase flavoprotein subunit